MAAKNTQLFATARLLQRQSLGVLEILDGIGRAEREEHRGIKHVQPEDVPVGHVEFQKLRPVDALRSGRLSRSRPRPVLAVEPVENRCRRQPRHRNTRAEPQRRLPAALVERMGPGCRGIDGIGTDAGEAEVERGGQRNAAAREPLCQPSDERNENRTFTDAEDEAAGHHDLVRAADCRERRAEHTYSCRPERDAGGSVTVDQQAVDERKCDVRDTDDTVQHPELRLTESALPQQQIGDRADDVVLVVAARYGDRRQHQHPPAQPRVAAAAAGIGRAGGLIHRILHRIAISKITSAERAGAIVFFISLPGWRRTEKTGCFQMRRRARGRTSASNQLRISRRRSASMRIAGPRPCFHSKRRIGGVRLQGCRSATNAASAERVAEHPFADQRLAVALGGRCNIEVVVLRVVLHAPERAAFVGECRAPAPRSH